MKDDLDTALLAGLAPVTWADTLRRQAVLRAHVAAAAQGKENIAATAEALGLAEVTTHRLIRVFERMQRGGAIPCNRHGVAVRLPQEVADIIDDVRRDLVGQLPTRALILEAARRCTLAGHEAPSEQTLRTRLLGSPVTDLRVVLGRRFTAIVDACPLLLDVATDNGIQVAILGSVLRASDGQVLAQHLFAGSIDEQTLVMMLRAAAEKITTFSSICATDAIALPNDDDGLPVDHVTGLGLRPGSAITAAKGLKIGKIKLRPWRREPGGSQAPEPVPIRAAQRVVAELLQVADVAPDP